MGYRSQLRHQGPGKTKGLRDHRQQAADWTATFLDSILMGWIAPLVLLYRPDGRLGIILDNAADGDWTAWLSNSMTDDRLVLFVPRGGKKQPNVCQLRMQSILRSLCGATKGWVLTVPQGAAVQAPLNQCSGTAAGTQLAIGSPLWFGSQANYDKLLVKQG